MRIAIDVRLLGKGKASGITEYTRELVNHLLAIDGNNTYILYYTGIRKAPLPPMWYEHPRVSIYDRSFPNRLLDTLTRFTGWPRLDTLLNADVIVSPHINLVAAGRAPYLITFHDLSFIHFPQFFTAKQRAWHALQRYARQTETATHIITDSAFTKYDLMQTLGISEEKITVIHPGLNAQFRRLRDDEPAYRAFQKEHRLDFPFILSLQTLEPRKNIPLLIRAFTIFKRAPEHARVRLILAGNAGWKGGGLAREIAASPYKDDILRWGPVENQERVFLYNKAMAFVYPSFFEGFGLPPLEAQACGCPVIVSERTSLPEVIRDSGLFVNPWDAHGLAQILARFMRDGAARDSLAQKGMENAARFSWHAAAHAFLTLIQKISHGTEPAKTDS